MSGTLYVVATPIGNLEDITLRALRVLREADLVAAEDTRRTARLFGHYAISTPTVSFHSHNLRQRLPQLLANLESGARVALVTDAGMPGVSDPGVDLVKACIQASIRVEPIPGASATLTAAVGSGFPLDPLTIFGFPPVRAAARREWLQRAADVGHTFVFFEAPHRIRRTLRDISDKMGDRPTSVARELTKLHEQFLRGPISAVIGHIAEPRGEFTVVVGPRQEEPTSQADVDDELIFAEFCQSTENSGGSRRAIVSALAKKHRLSSRDVYKVIERMKDSAK